MATNTMARLNWLYMAYNRPGVRNCYTIGMWCYSWTITYQELKDCLLMSICMKNDTSTLGGNRKIKQNTNTILVALRVRKMPALTIVAR